MKLFITLETPNYQYLIFENLPLGSLKFHMTKEQGYTAQNIAFIIKQLLYGLSHLHSGTKRIHRDVKADNILIESVDPILGPRIKLCDFGFAKELT